MKNILLGLLLGFFLLGLSPQAIYAVTITITSSPSTISLDSFNVGVSIDGASDGTNYLRVDLYKDGTSNYFGETYNGTSWHSDSTGTNYFPLQIQNATGSAILSARLGSPSSTEYPGSGAYKLKIRRYTSSGNPASGDTLAPADIQITYNFATPTPTSVPTPSPTATPTKTPTPVPTKTPTPKPTATSTTTPSPTGSPDAVLGATDDPTPSGSPITESENGSGNKFPFIAVGFILIGVGFLGFAFWPMIRAKYYHH